MRHSLSTFRFMPDMIKIQNGTVCLLTKLQLSSSDDGCQKLKNIYASHSTLGGAIYFNAAAVDNALRLFNVVHCRRLYNAVGSSIKIIQGQESGAQAARSSDGTKIKNKEILLFTFI